MNELIPIQQILKEYYSNEYSAELLLKHAVEHLKMTKQADDSTDQLRFKSACEISGEKHHEYVRGYEAAMDAVCKAQPVVEPVGWHVTYANGFDFMTDDIDELDDADEVESIVPLYTAPQAQPAPIPTSERLPTEDDGDFRGEIFGMTVKGVWHIIHWTALHSYTTHKYSHWLPTGLKMPPAP